MKTAKKKSRGPKARSSTTARKAAAPKAKKQKSSKEGLRELFEMELKDIFWAEKALTKAIPKMIRKATSVELVEALSNHLEETKGQVDRLEKVFEAIGKTAQAKKCEAMDGLIKEAEEIMKDLDSGMVRDAGIISAGQKVEHYEIATYGTLATFAKTLGEEEAASLLEKNLEEEKGADKKLTEIAMASINVEAADETPSENGEARTDKEKSGIRKSIAEMISFK